MEKGIIQKQFIENVSKIERIVLQIKVSLRANGFEQVIEALQKMDEQCRQVFSEERYAYYTKIFQQMIQTLQQGRTQRGRESFLAACGHCLELLQLVEKQFARDEELCAVKRKKKKIVFLPYKASMWDSLESIWRAAVQDKERCDTYVVPIPYADRNPDGTPKEWICEAADFPNEVPVLDYRNFDLEGMHPDIIYIHNPYDQCNAATSVDSRYYSWNLKKCADKVVYVPYFIVGDRWPELHRYLSCYDHVDKIVVQRENMEIVPRALSDMLESQVEHMSDYIPAEKLLPLGTPKLDRIFYCEKHLNLPAEWTDFAQGRKIIMYNTSISGILTHTIKFLNKMAYVFDSFAERKDVVLLWRPHPLMESCIQSVNSALYDKYMQLKRRFIEEKIGIFDATPDIDMTIAAVDAYLGESSSSVVQLFGFAGKPIFFTDEMTIWQKPTMEERASVQFGCNAVEPECIWFTAEGYNTFCCMDRQTGEITPLLQFPDHPYSTGFYNAFLRIGSKFYFSPGRAKEICEYDAANGEFKLAPYEHPLEFGNFGGVVPYTKYLFFLPSRYPALMRYDMETGECKYYAECLKDIQQKIKPPHEELLGPCAQRGIRAQKLLLPAMQSNLVLEFDMETEEYKIYPVGPEDADCGGIVAVDENIYWLFPWQGRKIRRWNYCTGECEVLEDYPEDFSCEQDWFDPRSQYMFSGILRFERKIWLFPCYSNMILRLDVDTRKIEKIDLALPYKWDERRSNYYMQQAKFLSVYPTGEHEITALTVFDRSFLIIDTDTMEWQMKPCRLSAEDVERLPTPMAEAFGRIGKDVPYAVGESPVGRSIDRFIDYVRDAEHNKHAQQEAYRVVSNNADGTCGAKVHDYMMRLLEQ